MVVSIKNDRYFKVIVLFSKNQHNKIKFCFLLMDSKNIHTYIVEIHINVRISVARSYRYEFQDGTHFVRKRREKTFKIINFSDRDSLSDYFKLVN